MAASLRELFKLLRGWIIGHLKHKFSASQIVTHEHRDELVAVAKVKHTKFMVIVHEGREVG